MCPFETCRLKRARAKWATCMFSGFAASQTTSRWTLHFLGSSANIPASAVPVPCLFQNRPIARLLTAFSRTIRPNNFALDIALPWVLNNELAKCEGNPLSGC